MKQKKPVKKKPLTAAQLLAKEKKDPNAYYRDHVMQYMEETDTPLYREDQMGNEDIVRICINPELNEENRVHLLRRAWFPIQRRMMQAGMVTLEVFSKAFDSYAFAIKDEYFHHLNASMGGMDKAWQEVMAHDKQCPFITTWYERLAIQNRDCPMGILVRNYTCLKEVPS